MYSSLFKSAHSSIWNSALPSFTPLRHAYFVIPRKNDIFGFIIWHSTFFKLVPTLKTFFYKRAGCALKWLMISSQPTVPPWSTYKKGMTTRYNWIGNLNVIYLFKECQFEILTLLLKNVCKDSPNLFDFLIHACTWFYFVAKLEGYFDQKTPNWCRWSLFLWIKHHVNNRRDNKYSTKSTALKITAYT